jgi:nucleoid DNA-binding protein
MNKRQLVAAVAADAGVAEKQVGQVITTFLDRITTAVSSGDEVNLKGFGKFSMKERKARQGRNPATGTPLSIGPVKLAKFRAGRAFKKQVRSTEA